MLINRLYPYPFERLSSFLERLGSANYYEGSKWYTDMFTSPLKEDIDALASEKHYQELAKLTGISKRAIHGLTIHRLLPAYKSFSKIEDKLQYWDSQSRQPFIEGMRLCKFCPYCWIDFKATFLPWLARHVTTCPIHKVLLVDTCSVCRRPLRPSFYKGICKECQTPLVALEPPSICLSEEALELTQVIWKAIFGVTTFRIASVNFPDCHPYHKMSPPALLFFLWGIYRVMSWYDPENPVFDNVIPRFSLSNLPDSMRMATVVEVHGALVAAWRLLRDWPKSWNLLLERILRRDKSLSKDNLRPFPAALIERFESQEFYWLHQSWIDYTHQFMDQNTRITSWLPYYQNIHEHFPQLTVPPLLSQREAASKLGVSEKRLQTFIESQQLKVAARSNNPSTRQWRLVPAESVEQLRELRARHVNLNEAARLIGTSPRQVVALVQEELLSAESGPLVNSKAVWRFDPSIIRSDIELLIGHLPVRLPDVKHVCRFHNVQKALSRYQMRLPRLLIDIKSGALLMMRLGHELNLDTLWCLPETLNEYKYIMSVTASPLLSASKVCERLNCKQNTLNRLTRYCLIESVIIGEPGGEKDQFTEEAVIAFLEQYITSDMAAQLLGVTQITIQNWARSGRIQAVTGPEIDGSHIYRFKKADLVQWREERLTFGETMALLNVSKATLDRWARQGKLAPLFDMGGSQRWFSREDVELLKSQL